MRRLLVTVQVILVVAGLGLGGYVGYRAYSLLGKDDTGQLQSYLVLAVLALLLVVAAGVVRPRESVEPPVSTPAPQRRAPDQPPGQQPTQQLSQQPGQPPGRQPYPPGGYRPGGPHSGSLPPVGPHTGPQPPVGGPDQPYGRHEQPYPRS